MDKNTKHIDKGERIITKGDPATRAYVILKGKARVFMEENGKQVVLGELGQGEIFGEASLFAECDYGAHVEAVEDCELDVIAKDVFREKLKACDPLIKMMFMLLVERQRKTNEALLESETREYMDIVLVDSD